MHESVLLKEVTEGLKVKNQEVLVDMTVGNAGHLKAILETGVTNLTVIGIDADSKAITKSKEVLAQYQSEHKIFFETTYFDSLEKILTEKQIDHVDKILFDLGFRSDQLDDPSKGLSFLQEGPLDMSFQSSIDLSQRENKLTASEIINEWQEDSLADIIFGFGEERFARRIAKKIVEVREQKKQNGQKIETTIELAEIIYQAVPFFYRHRRIHPATKTFQALRITVNSELQRLQTALEISFEKLSVNGRIAVISFHSLEDRIVKKFFREQKDKNLAKLITKKPITPTLTEIDKNPRSRSSKLRIVEKIK